MSKRDQAANDVAVADQPQEPAEPTANESTDAPEPSPAEAADKPETSSKPSPDASQKPANDRPAVPDLTEEQVRELSPRVEAAVLTAERAMTAAKLGEALGVPAKAVNQAVAILNQAYEETGRSFRIEQLAGGWRVMTLPQFADVLAGLHKTRTQSKLSPAALETLAIIAYKQPVIRADIETIRGVACGEVLRSLMERHLIKIVGRAEEIGRPMLYGTTKQFLEVFGLSNLKDLPKVEELNAGAGK